MPRNLLQDMVRKTPVKTRPIQKPVLVQVEKNPPRDTFSTYKKETNKRSKYRIYFVALVSVIFLLFALSFLFSGAKVTVVPKVKEIPLNNENLSATKNSDVQGLPFSLVVISGEESKTVPGGEMKDSSASAKGTILIYNAFSSSPQVLTIDTRLEGSNGKIYKTSKKITVPGMTKDAKPGSIEVEIYGAEAGEGYNSAPLDFKILGFKGTPKYSKFYGRSKGEITGGSIGKSPVVSSLDKATAVSELKSTLETKLLGKVTNQIPSGFILYKDAIFLDINEKDVSFTPDQNGAVLASIKGTLYGFLFDERKLTTKIAEDIIDGYQGNEVYMPNIRGLIFTLTDKENISFADVTSINFSLSGTPRVVYKVDEVKFATDLLAKKKADFNQVLAQYPNIDSAVLVIRPFWKSSFPEKSKNIEIIVNYPQ